MGALSNNFTQLTWYNSSLFETVSNHEKFYRFLRINKNIQNCSYWKISFFYFGTKFGNLRPFGTQIKLIKKLGVCKFDEILGFEKKGNFNWLFTGTFIYMSLFSKPPFYHLVEKLPGIAFRESAHKVQQLIPWEHFGITLHN